MHSSSLILFAIVALIAFSSVRTSAKPVKTTAAASSTTLAAPAQAPAAKPAAPAKKTPAKKGKKNEAAAWKNPNADQKKLFNDYKAILRTKLLARQQNVSATYPLEPAKHGSQTIGKSVLHHYLIKLPDGKYAHAIIGLEKDTKKPTKVNEHNASIRRTIYDNLAAAEA